MHLRRTLEVKAGQRHEAWQDSLKPQLGMKDRPVRLRILYDDVEMHITHNYSDDQ